MGTLVVDLRHYVDSVLTESKVTSVKSCRVEQGIATIVTNTGDGDDTQQYTVAPDGWAETSVDE